MEKNSRKFGVFFLAVFLLLANFGCTEDLYEKSLRKPIDRSEFNINRKSFKEFNKEKKFNNAFKKINSEIQNKKNSGKTIMEDMYNFTIDSTEINEVTTNLYTSYSIGVIRDTININYYENLFIEIDSTDVPQASLLKFKINPSTQEILSITSKLIEYNTNQSGKISYTPPCDYVTVTTETQCSCVGHWPGEACNCSMYGGTNPTSSTETFLVCNDDSQGSTTTTTTSVPTSENGGAGSGGISIFAPHIMSPEQLIIKEFTMGLSSVQQNWLFSQTEDVQSSINNYILQSSNIELGTTNNEAELFITELIDLAINYLSSFGNTQTNIDFISNIINNILNPSLDDVTSPELVVTPDCESFNFITINSNWQESAVLNIHFYVVLITPQGLTFNFAVEFPQAVLFGCPINLAVGNTNISSGLAANITAQCLYKTMNETVKKFGNKAVSGNMVEIYFKERLKHNYPLFLPGARVNFNANNYSVTPTQYQTNLLGIGDCN